MSTLHVIRHGQASFAADEYDRLSPLGHRQAALLGEYLAARGVHLDAVYAGTLARQQDTARGLIAGQPHAAELGEPREDAAFDEYDTYQIIMSQVADLIREEPALAAAAENFFTDRQAFKLVFEKAMVRWSAGQADAPQVETWDQFRERVQAGLDRVRAAHPSGETVAVCTSGGTISAIMQVALDLADDTAIRIAWQVRNAAVSTFVYDADRFSLQSFNSVAHLEVRDDPDLITFK